MRELRLAKDLLSDLETALSHRKLILKSDGYISTGGNVKLRYSSTALRRQIILIRALLLDVNKKLDIYY